MQYRCNIVNGMCVEEEAVDIFHSSGFRASCILHTAYCILQLASHMLVLVLVHHFCRLTDMTVKNLQLEYINRSRLKSRREER